MSVSKDQLNPSHAAVLGHPIHPMLVPLPIAFLSGALASDIAYVVTKDRFWARASRWLIGAGIASGAAAAPFGAWDFVNIPRARQTTDGWVHGAGNAAVLALSALNLASRRRDPRRGVVPTGLVLSATAAALLTVTGWFGGELTYRHLIGVVGSGKAPLVGPDASAATAAP